MPGELYKEIQKKYEKPATGIPSQDLSFLVTAEINKKAEIDDTAGVGDTDKTYSANKLAADHSSLLNAINGKADKANPVFTGSISLGRKANTSVGNRSFAVGNDVEASGADSHVEGRFSKATGDIAHAEGLTTTASASYTHAEGSNTTASSGGAHAEGMFSTASGMASHSQGYKTIANANFMSASGIYNKQADIYPAWVAGTSYEVGDRVTMLGAMYLECKTANSDETFDFNKWEEIDFSSDTLFVIGNGVDENHRSNAMQIDLHGNERLAGDLYVNCNPDSTGGDKVATDKNKADIIITSASGSIASISDGADDLPIEDMVVQIEPVQSGSGDPSPDNVRPISGWTGATVTRTGKNLWNPEIEHRYTSNLKIGGVVASGAPLPDGSLILLAGTYVVSVSEAMSGIYVAGANGSNIAVAYNKTFLTFTVPTKQACSIMLYKAGITIDVWDTYNIQLELGSTATAYEPYQGTTYPITWQSAGTLYGGAVNPVTGKLVVDWASITFDGTQAVGLPGWQSRSGSSAWLYVPSQTPGLEETTSAYTIPNIISDMLPTVAYTPVYNGDIGISRVQGAGSAWGLAVRVPVEGLTTAQLINAWLAENPIHVVYKVSTPQTYTLTPTEIRTLLGANNIWADTGDVSVEYRADTKLYVDRMSASGGITVDTALSSTSTNPVQNKVINTALSGKEPKHNTVTVSGTTPTISGVADTRYICGECSTLTITAPASGCIDVTFTSGSTPTVLTVTPPTGLAMKWANGFDPSSLDANTTYEINIMDGCLGVAGSWT